jgi:hypothetical protein
MGMQKIFSAASSLTPKVRIAAFSSHIGQEALGARAEAWSAESPMLTRFSEWKKLLFIVVSFVVVGMCCGSESRANPINPGAFTGACGPLPPPSWPTFKGRFDQFTMGLCYQQQQWPHEANRRSSDTRRLGNYQGRVS